VNCYTINTFKKYYILVNWNRKLITSVCEDSIGDKWPKPVPARVWYWWLRWLQWKTIAATSPLVTHRCL